MVTLSYLLLILLYEFFAVCEVISELLLTIFEHGVVSLCVETVHCDSGDFIVQILSLSFFLLYLLAYLLYSLLAICSCSVRGGLLIGLVLDFGEQSCAIARYS